MTTRRTAVLRPDFPRRHRLTPDFSGGSVQPDHRQASRRNSPAAEAVPRRPVRHEGGQQRPAVPLQRVRHGQPHRLGRRASRSGLSDHLSPEGHAGRGGFRPGCGSDEARCAGEGPQRRGRRHPRQAEPAPRRPARAEHPADRAGDRGGAAAQVPRDGAVLPQPRDRPATPIARSASAGPSSSATRPTRSPPTRPAGCTTTSPAIPMSATC